MQFSGQLDGKVVLLTGAASGIGSATAELFVQEGATLVATDIDQSGGERLLDRLQAIGTRQACFLRQNVAMESDWTGVIAEALTRFGRLDVLINNAGVMPALAPLEETSLEEWRRVMAINLDGVFLGVKHGIGTMKQSGGIIVNVSSVAGLVGMPITGAYSPSKAGVHLLTKSAALECAHLRYDIRVNSVHPGYIQTAMTEAIAEEFGDERFQRRLNSVVPLQRLGEPQDVAEAILFLSTERSKFMTGTALVVDGGWSAQ